MQAKRAEIRAENDFNVNMKAESEIKTLLVELQELKALILKQQ